MKSFTTKIDGREIRWDVDITVGTLKRVKGMLAIELCSLQENGADGLMNLCSDPVKFIDTLYVVCKKQADAANVSDEQFGEMFGYVSRNDAITAFIGAYFDFFLSPEQSRKASEIFATIGKKSDTAMTAELARAAEKAANIDLRKLADERLKRKSGISPASSESTPILARSAS
jgi:hypothetical protein